MVDQPGDEPFDSAGEQPEPITPHATPVLDDQGQADEQSVERVMATLQAGGDLFQQIEGLCHRWIAAVSGPDLDARAALVLLITTLETALEDTYGES